MALRGLNVDLSLGELRIEGRSLHTPAWCLLDPTPLWMPSAMRGENVIIPGVEGRRAYPLRMDEGRYALPMLVTGTVDQNGTAYASRWVGLQTNLKTIHTWFVAPPAAPTATQSAQLVMPDGTVRVASVQVVGFETENLALNSKPTIRAVLDLRVPGGMFEMPGGS